VVSISVPDHDRAVGGQGVHWQRIPRIGRTGDGVAPFPVTAPQQTPGGASPAWSTR
jgi:hypothetical protein